MNIARSLRSSLRFVIDYWKSVSGNWVVSITNKFVLLLFLLCVILLIWRLPNLPSQVPLWYAKPWGNDQLAHPFWLAILPATILMFYVLNLFVSAKFCAKHLIFTQLLFATSLLVALLSFIALAKILFLIT